MGYIQSLAGEPPFEELYLAEGKAMIPFAYQPGDSKLHRLHPLSRFILFITILILMRPLTWPYLTAGGLLIILGHLSSRISLRIPWRSILFFGFLTALILWGEWRQNGITPAVLKALRFMLTLYAGLIFASLTDPMELGETFYRLTRRIPLFPAGKMMLLISLSLSLLPLIGEEALHLQQAQKSRCADKRFNPFRRLYTLTYPLTAGLIRRSDFIARALYSRNVQENPSLLGEKPNPKDIIIIILSLSYIILSTILIKR